MQLIKGYALIKQTELDESLREAEKRGVEKGEKSSKARITELEKAVTKKQNELEAQADKAAAFQEKQNRKIEKLEATVEVLEADRDEARDVVQQQMKNEDTIALLDARKESLDEKEALLKDRESRLESKEEGRYKVGYADGVADGVRKISEITQKDRDNAMKIAMVSAASHTPLQNIKEINSEYRLTAGTEDSED